MKVQHIAEISISKETDQPTNKHEMPIKKIADTDLHFQQKHLQRILMYI